MKKNIWMLGMLLVILAAFSFAILGCGDDKPKDPINPDPETDCPCGKSTCTCPGDCECTAGCNCVLCVPGGTDPGREPTGIDCDCEDPYCTCEPGDCRCDEPAYAMSFRFDTFGIKPMRGIGIHPDFLPHRPLSDQFTVTSSNEDAIMIWTDENEDKETGEVTYSYSAVNYFKYQTGVNDQGQPEYAMDPLPGQVGDEAIITVTQGDLTASFKLVLTADVVMPVLTFEDSDVTIECEPFKMHWGVDEAYTWNLEGNDAAEALFAGAHRFVAVELAEAISDRVIGGFMCHVHTPWWTTQWECQMLGGSGTKYYVDCRNLATGQWEAEIIEITLHNWNMTELELADKLVSIGIYKTAPEGYTQLFDSRQQFLVYF